MTAPDEYDHDDDDDHPSVGDGNSINDDDPEDVKARKRKERLEQNRISARESRKRKKTMIEELQRTVITLSRENKELNERNEQLRRQLMEIGTKYGSDAVDGNDTASSRVVLLVVVIAGDVEALAGAASRTNGFPGTPRIASMNYPNVVPLQAIVGQAAAHAPSQDAAAAAAAAQAPALQPPPGQAPVGLGNFNPMAWFPGGANTGAPAGGNGQTNM
ncbi:predicted protein [Phaeodactylum tricornutum CCAP 1055/1]|uniref:BZIP domain-containing protein n=2 Tax=Phaeodactylum tricornutum TaxID=2850 RepID=B7G9T9_PHATC|nr:predicted protein [Phaeodactylum tricornutum CCAP 1055/1]EEC44502.1 predicted protein [Phaeodactylum tricornutum CCAP 1055/1]|eukprot:XP_002183833.1 predicted protein [Phaeodactylum tricornutum CCAP 1055/1]